MKDDLYFISVESRKGGVGKTTAALNLAAHFYQKNLPVLLIDVDITGTNIADIADSVYWHDKLNVLKNQDGNEGALKPVNLLELFLNRYMMQEEPFNLESYDFSRINVIGSSLYHDNGKDELLCNPSILFDEIHVYWLIEFLKSISDGFYNQRPDKTERAYIIFDNSPGYVGLANSIHDWLTDLGPINGKFLTISSLDDQDIMASKKAILSLHEEFRSKLKAAESYQKVKNSEVINDFEITEIEKNFFIKLATNSSNIEPFKNYADVNMLDKFSKAEQKLSEYQGLIFNKVQKEFFDNKKINDIFKRSFHDGDELIIPGNFPKTVPYQKIYNYQFNSYFFSNVYPKHDDRLDIDWNSFEMALSRIKKVENMPEDIRKNTHKDRIRSCQRIFNDICSQVKKVSTVFFDSILKEELGPEFPLIALKKNLNQFIRTTDVSGISYNHYIEGKKPVINIKDRIEILYMRKNFLSKGILHSDYEIGINTKSLINAYLDSYTNYCVGLIMYAIEDQISIPDQFMIDIFMVFIEAQLDFIVDRVNPMIDYSDFALKKTILRSKNLELSFDKIINSLDIGFRHPFIDLKQELTKDLYQSFCQALVRYMDCISDTRFFIDILKDIAETDSGINTNIKLINADRWLNKVIIMKEESHEVGYKKYQKEKATIAYMEDFQKALKPIIEDWKLKQWN